MSQPSSSPLSSPSRKGKSTRRSSSPMSPLSSMPITTTPVNSPPRRFSSPPSSRGDAVLLSDRFIPSRLSSNLEDAFDMLGSSERQNDRCDVSHENQTMMNNLLRSELLGHPHVVMNYDRNNANQPMSHSSSSSSVHSSSGLPPSTSSSSSSSSSSYSSASSTVFSFPPSSASASSSSSSPSSPSSSFSSQSLRGRDSPSSGRPNVLRYRSLCQDPSSSNNYPELSTQPFGSKSPTNYAGTSPRKQVRKVPKVPYKVLDAPSLQDDYYLNLVDWSSTNILSVALASSVYLWSACTSKVTKLCDIPQDPSSSPAGTNNTVTSISWSLPGNLIAVGTNSGQVQIWDASKCQKVRDLCSHSSRVGSLAWNSHVLASGSRDRNIFLQDIRVRSGGGDGGSSPSVTQLSSHKQEVCGLKWSFDERMLASGGNDNKLFVWQPQHGDPCSPLRRFDDHTAAVKAVAWSPHQHGLLASGGGTADRNIRFWNALTGASLHRIDTGSQVCNLMWSKNVNEIVSTHGYSLNQIIVWRYPSMQKLTTLTGHTLRVLYLAMSPDGQSVVTGAGDETLRFWNIFPGPRSSAGARVGPSLLLPSGSDIR